MFVEREQMTLENGTRRCPLWKQIFNTTKKEILQTLADNGSDNPSKVKMEM